MEQNRKPLTYEDIVRVLAKMPTIPPRRLYIFKQHYIQHKALFDQISPTRLEPIVLLEPSLDYVDLSFLKYFMYEHYHIIEGRQYYFRADHINMLPKFLQPFINELQTKEKAAGRHQGTEEP